MNWIICDDGYVRCQKCRSKALWCFDGNGDYCQVASDYCPWCGEKLDKLAVEDEVDE